MGKRLILFGAGRNGILALEKYGKDQVAYFADNSKEKQGTYIEGIEVISYSKMLEYHEQGYVIVVTPEYNAFLMGQLELSGIDDYLVFKTEENIHVIAGMQKAEEDYKENNMLLNSWVTETKQVDLLTDVSGLKRIAAEVLKRNKEDGISLIKRGIGGEGNFYGNLQGLISYAELPEDAELFFPVVSHQDCFPLYTPGFQHKSAVVFSGEYYKKKVHERAPYVPVFIVGPYINYVSGIYDNEKVRELKQKNGKTLLAFLPHSIESVGRLYDKRLFIDELLSIYAKDFTHIMLCAYWADLNDPVCEYAAEKGIQVVSAGLRFDTEFDRRLRTIIELSDGVVCGDIGTHIAYSLCLGKPVARISISNNQKIADGEVHSDIERKLQFSNEYKEFDNGFYTFFNHELKNVEAQKVWMNPVCGFDQIKSKEYIRNVYTISKDIWLEADGNLYNYPGAVRRVFQNFEKDSRFDMMCILKSAVGAYLD